MPSVCPQQTSLVHPKQFPSVPSHQTPSISVPTADFLGTATQSNFPQCHSHQTPSDVPSADCPWCARQQISLGVPTSDTIGVPTADALGVPTSDCPWCAPTSFHHRCAHSRHALGVPTADALGVPTADCHSMCTHSSFHW